MDHQPPPFFKRGPAPIVRLFFYAALSMAMLFVDARFHTLELVRSGISVLTHPIQQAAHMPSAFFGRLTHYVSSFSEMEAENSRLKQKALEEAPERLRAEQLEKENERLRKLLDIRERPTLKGLVGQILYSARDPFSRRIVVDKGQQDAVTLGQPVIDGLGVIGQVTRVFPFVSEITLITDKDQAVPVQVVRNGLRSVLFGLGDGQLELRFMPVNADVVSGDLIVTSGLDGIFPPGLPVAKVVHIEHNPSYSFARILSVPVAGVENYSEVLILNPYASPEMKRLSNEARAIEQKPATRRASTRRSRNRRE